MSLRPWSWSSIAENQLSRQNFLDISSKIVSYKRHFIIIVNKQLILPDEVSMSRMKDANVYFMI